MRITSNGAASMQLVTEALCMLAGFVCLAVYVPTLYASIPVSQVNPAHKAPLLPARQPAPSQRPVTAQRGPKFEWLVVHRAETVANWPRRAACSELPTLQATRSSFGCIGSSHAPHWRGLAHQPTDSTWHRPLRGQWPHGWLPGPARTQPALSD